MYPARTKANKQDTCSTQLEYLMRRFGDQVLQLAYFYVRDRYLAEDIAQEVFCRVYRNLDSFRQNCSYFTWIYRITINLCRDYLRSSSFRRLIPWGDSQTLESLGGKTDRFFEAVEGGEIFQKVMDLPVNYRVVIALHYFQGFSTTEIARLTGLTESNVRTRLSRARRLLKKTLANTGEVNRRETSRS